MPRKKKAEKKKDDDSGEVYVEKFCKCGEWKKDGYVGCDTEGCGSWWHWGCIGWPNLTEELIKALSVTELKWNCPACIMKELTGKKEVAEVVKEEVVKLLPDIVEQVMEAKKKKYSQFFKENQEETKQVIKKTMSENHEKVVKEALIESKQKMDSDHVERERRKNNVVIKGVPESKKNTQKEQTEEDMDFVRCLLELDDQDVLYVSRAGPRIGSLPNDQRKSRPLVAQLATPELASQKHGHGFGKKWYMMSEMGEQEMDEYYYVNKDLIYSDRVADYEARKAKKARAAAAAPPVQQTKNVEPVIAEPVIAEPVTEKTPLLKTPVVSNDNASSDF